MTYFDKTNYIVSDGNIVYAKDINNPLSAIETGLSTLSVDVQKGAITYAEDTGVTNAYACALSPVVAAYTEGLEVWLKPANTNTGESTLSVNALDPVPILRIGLSPLSAGDLAANYYVHLKYSNGKFQIVSNVGTPDAQAQLYANAASVSADEAADSAEDALESYNNVVSALSSKLDKVGTTTNNNAASGYIGEYKSVIQVSPQYATSSVLKNITSLSLTAGDWDVSGSFGLESGVETVVYFAQAGFSTTSSGSPSFGSKAAGIISVAGIAITTGASGSPSYTVPTIRVSIAATTVIYLNGLAIFTAGTIGLFGSITARRAR